jgi:hypothetical protein
VLYSPVKRSADDDSSSSSENMVPPLDHEPPGCGCNGRQKSQQVNDALNCSISLVKEQMQMEIVIGPCLLCEYLFGGALKRNKIFNASQISKGFA